MIKRLAYQTGFPVWIGELPGDNSGLDILKNSRGSQLMFNLDMRMVWAPSDWLHGIPIEEYSVSDSHMLFERSPEDSSWRAIAYEKSPAMLNAKSAAMLFVPSKWCVFRYGLLPHMYDLSRLEVRKVFLTATDNPVFELACIDYAVGLDGSAVVHSESGFIPAVAETVALMQTCANRVEIDEGVKHVNLVFAGKSPTEVYLPDSCVSCYVPNRFSAKLSIGDKLASVWEHWSAVWGKGYNVPDNFKTTPDGLVTVRGR